MRQYLASLLITLCLGGNAFAADEVKVEKFTLDNGMEVVVIPNHRVPAVSHMLWFRIGSADEQKGSSGLAHYLEHMMFKGTKTLKVGEYSQTVSKFGGDHNAFTSFDFTGYYVNIARDNLPMVMKLEADRMVNLQVDEAEFTKEREVIIEERSMRTDNQPSAVLSEQMRAALFLNHPYHTSIIGWRHEMSTLSREQVFEMYRRYYHPNNAVLIVAGDITAKELKPLAETIYGALPKGETLTRNWTEEPAPNSERRVIHRDEKVLQQSFERDYLAPGFVHGEKQHAFALSLLSQVLGGTDTSRLYQDLVVKRKLAVGAQAYYSGIDLGPSTFSVSAVPAEGVSLEALEKGVDEVLRGIQTKPVTEAELTRAKTQAKASIIYARDGLQSLAYIFGQLYMVGLDEAFFNAWPENIEAVTLQQVQDAAAFVLKPERSVTGWLLPQEQANPAVKAAEKPAVKPAAKEEKAP